MYGILLAFTNLTLSCVNLPKFIYFYWRDKFYGISEASANFFN